MEGRVETIVKLLSDKKAEDILVLDVRSKVDYTDHFIICSAHSTRHAQGISDYVISELEKLNLKPLGVEGWETGNWIILDYNTVIVHIFFEPVRALYALEELWAEYLPRRREVPSQERDTFQ
ncbi:MAG: ribosome silencing factor [Caldimicrobium sp.]|nr:ribosome silencing factor [Caldimicrobium sp.]MCX7613632.1 ribosome silencing factor [Caldimicrobium sp.]MDW8183111.1 ribosome silencing factor [Caldimicrobium sp.]